MEPSKPAGIQSPAAAMPRRVRILFVDDEAPVLNILSVAMRSMAREWETHFTDNGTNALKLVAEQPFDVIVSDMRMPGMNGAQLLNQVMREHPHTVRIILSGYSDLREAMSCVGIAHQFLHKPCNLADLKNCIRRVTQMGAKLDNDDLLALAARLSSLPSAPDLYLQMIEALESPDATTQRIAEIASKDPALSAKLLQLSNSAFFGFGREVCTVEEAVQQLGVSIIQSLALAVPMFAHFDPQKCPSFPLEQIWHHSEQTGLYARWIAREGLGDAQVAEQAFAAGVLHDISKLILADQLPGEYSTVLAQSKSLKSPLFDVERRILGATHADIGAYLLTLWGLPLPLVEGVAYHHEPQLFSEKSFSLIGAVHIANILEREHADHDHVIISEINADYLATTGVANKLDSWREHFKNGADN